MQTILNYSNLTSTASTSPYIQSLLAQYGNYPGASHQQYLDVLNLYSKYAQTSLGFPDMNAMAAANMNVNAINATKPPMPGAANVANNPLSALGDLTGFYGMSGLAKNYASSNAGTATSNAATSMFLPRSTTANDSLLFPPQFNGKSTAAYPTAYSHAGLYNFGNDYTPTAANAMNLSYPSNSAAAAAAPAMHLSNTAVAAPAPTATPPSTLTTSSATFNMYPNSITSSLTTTTTTSTTTNSNKAKNNNNSNSSAKSAAASRIDLTKLPEYSSTNPPPLVDLTKTTMQTSPNTMNSSNKRAITTSAASFNKTATNTTITTTLAMHKDAGMQRPHPVSIAVSALHKNAPTPATTIAANNNNNNNNHNKNLTAAETTLKKLNSEMLIIPTTSPPGPTSISKQFNDISPSISLTALNNTPTLTPINTTNNNNKNLNNKQQMPSPTYLPLANGKSNNIKQTTTTKPVPPLSKTPKIKVANFATLTRQTIPANNNSNMRKITTTTPTTTSTSKTVNRPPNIMQTNVIKNTTPTTAIANTSVSGSSVITKRNNNAYPPLVNLSWSNQKKSNTTSTALTPAQLQKLRTLGANTPPLGNAASKPSNNEISIRPMDAKSNSAANNVYIIETNINDKRVAIGAPTKSGNGTTVTKVTTPAKRKNTEMLQTERKKQR